MRSRLLFALPALLYTPLAAGCNAVFGLDEVSERAPTGTGGAGGGGAGGSPGSGGASGGAGCPDLPASNNLVVNGSFEEDSAWKASGANFDLEYVTGESCALACGDRVARLSGQVADMEYTTLSLDQDIGQTVELGGVLRLGGRYTFEGESAPYFTLLTNGYYLGGGFFKGAQKGDVYVIDDVVIPVDDPRRADDQVRLFWQQAVDGTHGPDSASSMVDCVSLTYEDPPGMEILPNGWFEAGDMGWEAQTGAVFDQDILQGLCGHVAAKLTVPMGFGGDVLTTTSTLKDEWPAGTVFKVGAAAGPPLPTQEDPAPVIPPVKFILHLDYEEDGIMATLDSEEAEADGTTGSEAWRKAVITHEAKRPVVAVSLRMAVEGGMAEPAAEILADCFTIRAISPVP